MSCRPPWYRRHPNLAYWLLCAMFALICFGCLFG